MRTAFALRTQGNTSMGDQNVWGDILKWLVPALLAIGGYVARIFQEKGKVLKTVDVVQEQVERVVTDVTRLRESVNALETLAVTVREHTLKLDKIDDARDRITRLEARFDGFQTQLTELNANIKMYSELIRTKS